MKYQRIETFVKLYEEDLRQNPAFLAEQLQAMPREVEQMKAQIKEIEDILGGKTHEETTFQIIQDRHLENTVKALEADLEEHETTLRALEQFAQSNGNIPLLDCFKMELTQND